MGLVRKIKIAGLSYQEFVLNLRHALMSSGCSSTRVDVVFDVYRKISIKSTERARGKSGNLKFKKILGS